MRRQSKARAISHTTAQLRAAFRPRKRGLSI
jgi:hypothetical protein